jgi:hypothetical protein
MGNRGVRRLFHQLYVPDPEFASLMLLYTCSSGKAHDQKCKRLSRKGRGRSRTFGNSALLAVCASPILGFMEASQFDEAEFFAAIAGSSARAILIGRRALIALGLPLLTRDYDFWIHGDEIHLFNAAVARFGLFPNRPPEEAHAFGRYVLENDERVDVIVARTVFTVDKVRVAFDDVWTRRQSIEISPGVKTAIPSLDDLILTKRFGGRPKDAEDIRMLEALRSEPK